MEDVVQQLIEFGAAAVQAGLLSSTCGNASIRIGDDKLAISASGSQLKALTADHIAVVHIATGERVSGPKASMETDLHRQSYLKRPKARAILHGQSRAATLLCCMPSPPRNLDLIPEIPAYVRGHAYVPFAMPGSAELAESVAAAFEDPEVTVVQMRNHGQVVLGSSWASAVRRGSFFELACWLASQGPEVTTIDPTCAEALRGYARDV